MQIGYDPDFIGGGVRVPLPKFNRSLAQSVLRRPDDLRNGIYSDHAHFTIVMNEHTRQLIYSAYNIDQNQFRGKVKGEGKRSWRNDKAVGAENQLDNDYYKDRTGPNGKKIKNPYDRGHMVMRFNNMWGATDAESDKAGKATFVYSNSSLQHENLNRDEWKEVELEIVRKLDVSANGRLAVFTGPIYGDLDRHINLTDQDSARVPSGFFKVVCYRSKSNAPKEKLGVFAFAIFQDDKVLRDKKGAATVKTDRRYQVTISELQNMTGINFGKPLYDANPLYYSNRTGRPEKYKVPILPERIPVNTVDDMIVASDQVRCDMAALDERKIIIHSAMIDPKGDETRGEWVSLYNRGGRKTSVKGWRLVDGIGREATLDGAVLSGESLKLKGRAKGKVKLANAGGSLMLYDEHGCVIDHVSWSKHDLAKIGEGVAYMFERGQ